MVIESDFIACEAKPEGGRDAGPGSLEIRIWTWLWLDIAPGRSVAPAWLAVLLAAQDNNIGRPIPLSS